MAKFSAEEVLEAMAELKLTPPAALRPGKDSYPSIVGGEIGQDNSPFFIDMRLDVDWGNGDPKPFIVRSNVGGDGAIALAVLDGKIVQVRQWRAPLGRFTWEVTRGFSELWDSGAEATLESIAKVKALATAVRELSEETETEVTGKVVPTLLGNIAENSGTHCGSPAYWLLELAGVEFTGNDNVRLVTLNEAIDTVEDSHSATALLLYQRHLNK